MRVAAILPAAGEGRRLKAGQPKALVAVLGKPLAIHTLQALKKAFPFQEMILVVACSQEKKFQRLLKLFRLDRVRLVYGGKTRAESVRNGFLAVSQNCDWVLVHDVARPLVTPGLVRQLLKEALKSSAVIAARPVHETVKRVKQPGKTIARTEDRRVLFLAETPQVFKKDLLARRYAELGKKALSATDEAALFDGTRTRVKIVSGERRNIKITTREDIELMEFYASRHRIRHSRA